MKKLKISSKIIHENNKRYMERGYNQSYLIAKHISEKVNKPLCRFVLIKSKNNKKQSELGVKARITNVNNVYNVKGRHKFGGYYGKD